MDLITYPSMDTLPFQQQHQLFDCVDEDFELEQLLAVAFDSSFSSSELFQCHSNNDDICFDPLCSVSECFVDDKTDVFVAEDDALFPQNLFVSPLDHHYQLGNEINNHSVEIFQNDENDVFVSDNDVLFPQNLFISPCDQFYPPDNSFNKRQKMSQNDESNSFLHELLAPPPPPPPPFHFDIPPVFSHGISSNNKYGDKEESRSLSAQSLSARQRRRKISEKTKELGKLVPGGQKMNTAEMFEAASSYIKFLQAQFAILQLMEPSSHEQYEEDLQCLVGSPLVQEKLYLKQKCIAPKGLIQSLENNNEIQSNSQTLKDVRNLILTFC